jgi:hypothetical protein
MQNEGATLISGTVADWRAASEQARTLYSLASADALREAGVPIERQMLMQAFKLCMESEAARAESSALLGDVSYECATAFQEGDYSD